MQILGSFDQTNPTDSLGVKGFFIFKLKELKLRYSPAALVESRSFKNLTLENAPRIVRQGIEHIHREFGARTKDFCFFKIMLSPSILCDTAYPSSIHNLGLNAKTVDIYGKIISDETFAYEEWRKLITDYAEIVYPEIGLSKQKKFAELDAKTFCEKVLREHSELDVGMEEQIKNILLAYRKKFYPDENSLQIPCAVIIQSMVYGHKGDNNYVGTFYTRDPQTGEKKTRFEITRNSFSVQPENLIAKSEIPAVIDSDINEISEVLEDEFKDIRKVDFVFDEGRLFILKQEKANASIQALLRIHLDLYEQGRISKSTLLNHVKPDQLGDLLHPVIVKSQIDPGIKFYEGGLTGSIGSAKGRLFTSTEKFMEAFFSVGSERADKHIICMPATYANDVKAIEMGSGVISSEGGYASHAPVVARSLGKPAVLIPGLVFKENGVVFPDGTFVKDGEYVAFEADKLKPPVVYFGDVKLDYPNLEENGIYQFTDFLAKETKDVQVYCNADSAKDASIAKKFGAEGIGLCRTEHMFFGEERILNLLWMFFSDTPENRKEPLRTLKQIQKRDFIPLFKEMGDKSVNVRLLDAPLHEFVPKEKAELEKVFVFLRDKGIDTTMEEMESRFDKLSEVNPMLGHRGIRMGISYPDIYEMQSEAIVEAALEAHLETGVKPQVEIMLPFLMSDDELKFIRNGKDIEGSLVQGIDGSLDKTLKDFGYEEFPFSVKVGVMIETPAAALNAAYIAKQAEFFSFGTNDLTQMVHAISRDDVNSFLPEYTKYDIFLNNPFQILTNPVKEILSIAVSLGRMIRPDLKIGLCGEHGANGANTGFCRKIGLDYISCSSYGIPSALLSIVQECQQE